MNDETSTTQARARRGYAVIDQTDQVDVTSYDSFPASDPPSWIATGIGEPHLQELADNDSTRSPEGSSTVVPDIEQDGAGDPGRASRWSPRMNPTYQAPLYLLPFDHRYCYVAGLFRFTPSVTTEQHRAVKSGSHAFDFEYGDAFAKHIEALQPVFATVLVRYNPEDDAALNKRQTKRLKELSDYCRAVGQPFMFELLIPAMKAQSDRVRADERVYDRRIRPHVTAEAVCVIKDAGVEPDSWKVEGFDSREDGERVVSAAEREGRGAVGSSVLERDADANEVVHWHKAAAAVPGFAGFAVERTTFWDAVTDFMEASVTSAEAVSGIRGWVAVSKRGTNTVTTPMPLVPRHITQASLAPARSPRFHSIVRDRARQPHNPRGHTN